MAEKVFAIDVQMVGNTVWGSKESGGDLHLKPTSHATRGSIIFGAMSGMIFDDVDSTLALGGATATHKLHIKGDIASGMKIEGPLSFGAGGGIQFGDSNFVYVQEDVDDHFLIHGKSGVRLTVDALTNYSGIGTSTTHSNTWDNQGSRGAQVSAVNVESFTAGEEEVILCNTADIGAFTLTLPSASTCTGRIYHIKLVESAGGALTIDGADTETIDGATTLDLASQYDAVMIVSDGSNWHVLATTP